MLEEGHQECKVRGGAMAQQLIALALAVARLWMQLLSPTRWLTTTPNSSPRV